MANHMSEKQMKVYFADELEKTRQLLVDREKELNNIIGRFLELNLDVNILTKGNLNLKEAINDENFACLFISDFLSAKTTFDKVYYGVNFTNFSWSNEVRKQLEFKRKNYSTVKQFIEDIDGAIEILKEGE